MDLEHPLYDHRPQIMWKSVQMHVGNLRFSLSISFWPSDLTIMQPLHYLLLVSWLLLLPGGWYRPHNLRLLVLQQNSSPAPMPDPKPTMIDEWAVSVKPNADPTIIKKHIEKMVEVSLPAPANSPLWYLWSARSAVMTPQAWGWKQKDKTA